MAAAYVTNYLFSLHRSILYGYSAFRYEILNDPNTREVYDAHGMDGLGGPGPAGMDPDDLFAHFFGATFSFGAGGSSRRRKGQNEVVPYDVTLEDLYNGKTVKMNMEKDVTCSVCKGCVSINDCVRA